MDQPSTPQRARADAETRDALVLVKYAAALHATWQVRALAARARDRRMFRRYGALRVNMSPTTHWSPREAARLAGELVHLREALRQAPAQPFPSGSWQAARAAELGLAPTSLAECFFDFDGGPLFDRLLELCRVAVEAREPILFQ